MAIEILLHKYQIYIKGNLNKIASNNYLKSNKSNKTNLDIHNKDL